MALDAGGFLLKKDRQKTGPLQESSTLTFIAQSAFCSACSSDAKRLLPADRAAAIMLRLFRKVRLSTTPSLSERSQISCANSILSRTGGRDLAACSGSHVMLNPGVA